MLQHPQGWQQHPWISKDQKRLEISSTLQFWHLHCPTSLQAFGQQLDVLSVSACLSQRHESLWIREKQYFIFLFSGIWGKVPSVKGTASDKQCFWLMSLHKYLLPPFIHTVYKILASHHCWVKSNEPQFVVWFTVGFVQIALTSHAKLYHFKRIKEGLCYKTNKNHLHLPRVLPSVHILHERSFSQQNGKIADFNKARFRLIVFFTSCAWKLSPVVV